MTTNDHEGIASLLKLVESVGAEVSITIEGAEIPSIEVLRLNDTSGWVGMIPDLDIDVALEPAGNMWKLVTAVELILESKGLIG